MLPGTKAPEPFLFSIERAQRADYLLFTCVSRALSPKRLLAPTGAEERSETPENGAEERTRTSTS